MKKSISFSLLLSMAAITFGQLEEVEVSTVFRSLQIFAEVAKTEAEIFAPQEDSDLYAFSKLTEHYSEYNEGELLLILLRAEEKGLQPLSEFSLAWLYMSAAKDNRLPTIPEIVDEMLPGRGEGIEYLCVMLEDYPGGDFESAATKIGALCPLSRSDLGKVLDAFINVFQGQYNNLGNQYMTGGYYHMAYERMDPILKPQRREVREILHGKLAGNKPELVATSAFLLALYGDLSSISLLEGVQGRFQENQNYQILVGAALDVLKQDYASSYGTQL